VLANWNRGGQIVASGRSKGFVLANSYRCPSYLAPPSQSRPPVLALVCAPVLEWMCALVLVCASQRVTNT